MMRRTLIALAAVAAIPSTAVAEPVLSPLKPCYVFVRVDVASGRNVAEYADVRGSGYTPGAEVTVLVDGTTVGKVTADETGAIAAQVQAPVQERGEREFSVSALENGGAGATVLSRVTRLEVTAAPKTATWRRRVTYTGRGFTDLGKPIYGHYFKRRTARRSVRFGMPRGPCGTFKTRRRQFPFKPSLGRWFLRVDQEREFDFDVETSYFDLEIFVAARPKPGR